MKKSIIVTGSSGLIGSTCVTYFSNKGYKVHGIDSNQRKVFFGPQGDTSWQTNKLIKEIPSFSHHEIDIRDRKKIFDIVKKIKPTAIIHAAAQPSHDKAASIPFDDFEVNAVGTLNLLESARKYCKDSPFVHMSTNKVYGDLPNTIKLKELDTRWDYDDPKFKNGIPESFSIDQSKHSLFGASKLASDILVQEYGRYFDMPTCCIRAGCLTGENHSGVELHGFLSYLMKCNKQKKLYKIYGYKGKQVRDNIHSQDVSQFIECFLDFPEKGGVYNLGGGKENSCSIIEAFSLVEKITGIEQKYTYESENRSGDHICYYSDLSKIKERFPSFEIRVSLQDIFKKIHENDQP